MYINHEYDTYEACVRNVPEQLRVKKIFSCHAPSCACLLHAVVDGPALPVSSSALYLVSLMKSTMGKVVYDASQICIVAFLGPPSSRR